MNRFSNTSNLCQKEIADLIRSPETWYEGIKMLDAWGKPISGYLNGQTVSLGDFDECINIESETPKGLIQGKYCFIPFVPITGVAQSGQGICIPHNCELPETQLVEVFCQTKNSTRVFDEYDYFAIFCFVMMFLVLTMSTFYDEWKRRFNKDGVALFRIFSVTSNWKKLFCTKIGPDQVSCLAGFRTITMIWILAAHEYLFAATFPLENPIAALQFYFDPMNFYITGAFTGIDTFIFIGGFVLCYQCVINIDNERLKVKTIPIFYMHRLLRLVPPMATLFLINVSLMRRFNSGPIYPTVTGIAHQQCLNNWIPYFFFYQNYLKLGLNEKCGPQTWYLNMDMHLYLFSPLVLIPLTRCIMNKKKVQIMWLFAISTLIAALVPTIVSFYTDYCYYHSHPRIISYIIGIMSGYLIAVTRNSRKTFPWWFNLIAWTICISIMFICVYEIGEFESRTRNLDIGNQALYNIVGRTIWCCSLTWIVFFCTNNKRGVLNRFLSNPLFLVVGKLSFACYLLHMNVMGTTMGGERTLSYFGFTPLFLRTISHLFVTNVIAILWVLCLESPAIAFSKILYEWNLKAKEKSKNDILSS